MIRSGIEVEQQDVQDRPAVTALPLGGPTALSVVLGLQRAAGNRAVAGMLARQPQRRPAAPTPSSDDIARAFGAADWATFKAERQAQHDTVFGHDVNGLLPVFLEKLRAAETAVAASQNGGQPIAGEEWRTRFGITSVGGLRFNASGGPASTHGWGLAIDINYRGAPFVMHESREQDLDAQLGPVYHRIAWLILGHASQIPEAITRAQRSDDTRQWFRALQAESEAMRRYFQMMRDPNDINWNTVYEDVTDAIWANLGLGPMPNPGDPQQAQVAVRDVLRRQMAQDYATLGAAGGADVGGGVMTPTLPAVQRRPDAQGNRGAADRPFASRDPAQGFLDLNEEVVVALRAQSGVRWGAIDFGGESGDVMHFDIRGELEAKRAAAVRALQEAQRAAEAATAAPADPALARAVRALQRQPTQAQELGAMPRTDLTIRVSTGTTEELRAERDRLRGIQAADAATLTSEEAGEAARSIERLDLLIAERGNSTLADAGVELIFDGHELRMLGAGATALAAVSGRPASDGRFDYSPERQRLERTGPIPEGEYWIDPRQLKDLSLHGLISGDYAAAWGSHRITIHPFDSTHTFGRGGFFIHGGTMPGSAGCIDLTSGMPRFAALISAVPPGQKVKLRVAYPTLGDFPAPPTDQRPA